MALIFNLRFILLSPPNMVPFHKKIVPEKDYCNRTTGKSADQVLKLRIRRWFEFEEFLKMVNPIEILFK